MNHSVDKLRAWRPFGRGAVALAIRRLGRLDASMLHSTCKTLGAIVASVVVTQFAMAASDSPDWRDVSEADQNLMGDWEGSWVNPPDDSYQKINPPLAAQVVNVGPGRYDITFAQELYHRADPYFSGEGSVGPDGKIQVDRDGWRFTVEPGKLSGVAHVGKHRIQFELNPVQKLSPTLGLAPPRGATVLFDGSDFSQWQHDDGREVTWTLLDDGVMEINPSAANKGVEPPIGGGIRTKKGFKDVRLHLEFRYPVEPYRSGQGRGNSGLFFQGAYEAQILNSYGLAGNWNECGALYKLWPPQVNAARPPMVWQTYDVEYRAARFENGKVVENPRITVRLNGDLVQNDTEIVHHTAHRFEDRDNPVPADPGPIMLQDHSNRIQFRNIWVQELK